MTRIVAFTLVLASLCIMVAVAAKAGTICTSTRIGDTTYTYCN